MPARDASRQLDQLVERRRQLSRGVAVERQPVLAQRLVGLTDRQLAVHDAGAVVPSTLRVSACAQTAPNSPVLAPITAAGLPRSGVSARGREAQSIAFFSTPGIEELYSGVAISSASAAAIAAFSARDLAGGVVSSSSLNGGIAPSRSNSTSSAPSGSSVAGARAAASCCGSRGAGFPTVRGSSSL